jgi:hypothetical protein
MLKSRRGRRCRRGSCRGLFLGRFLQWKSRSRDRWSRCRGSRLVLGEGCRRLLEGERGWHVSLKDLLDLLTTRFPLESLEVRWRCASRVAFCPRECLIHPLASLHPHFHIRAYSSLTICVVCTSSTPSQDIIGIRLHRASTILPPLQSRRGNA